MKQRILVYWEKRKKEPWFLATNMEWGWKHLVVAYKQRMTIEELFRDEKNIRYGWGLRQLKISTPERLERMFLVLAYAYLLLLLLGLICETRFRRSVWCSAIGRRKQSSAFTIGRYMTEKVKFRITELFILLGTLLAQAAQENWG